MRKDIHPDQDQDPIFMKVVLLFTTQGITVEAHKLMTRDTTRDIRAQGQQLTVHDIGAVALHSIRHIRAAGQHHTVQDIRTMAL